MANKTNNTNLDDFRRELEEDIRNFKADDTKSAVKMTRTHHASNNSARTSSYEKKASPSSRSGRTHNMVSSSSHNSHHGSHTHKKKKKTRKPLKVLCILLAIVFLLGVGGYGFLHWELNRINRKENDEVTRDEIDNALDTEDLYGLGNSDTKLISDPDVKNILLIGQDRKKGDKAEMRSDAMIICSINSRTKEITLCSLMRDMYVPVPGYGYGMLNHTYMIGGFDLLNKTIEKNFGVPIDGNIEVDFERFMNLIDLLGGVNVVVTEEEAKYMNGQKAGWNLVGGTNRLTSEQALMYCRIRKNIGGDWGRTDRQRKVIMEAFNQLKSSGAKTILNFVHAAIPSLTTNLSNTKIIKYAYALTLYSMDPDYSYRIPKEGSYTQEVREETLHVLIPDIQQNAKEIQKYLYRK